MINSWKCHILCDLVLNYERNRWEFEHIIRNSMGNEISSIYKMKAKLHAMILTVVHAEVVCTLKILPIGIFLSQSYNRNNSDGKASLKWHRLPETTTDTQDVSKFWLILYWMFIVWNIYLCKSTIFRSQYYILYNMFKFSMVLLITPH